MAVAGNYWASGSIMGNSAESELTFAVDGNVLTGTIFIMNNEAEILDGEVDGDNFTAAFDVSSPMGSMRIKMAGTVTGDDIEFMLRTPMGKAKFNGKRS